MIGRQLVFWNILDNLLVNPAWWKYSLVGPVSDALGCGDTCDLEFVIAYAFCDVDDYDDVDDYMESVALFFDSDCYDCLFKMTPLFCWFESRKHIKSIKLIKTLHDTLSSTCLSFLVWLKSHIKSSFIHLVPEPFLFEPTIKWIIISKFLKSSNTIKANLRVFSPFVTNILSPLPREKSSQENLSLLQDAPFLNSTVQSTPLVYLGPSWVE